MTDLTAEEARKLTAEADVVAKCVTRALEKVRMRASEGYLRTDLCLDRVEQMYSKEICKVLRTKGFKVEHYPLSYFYGSIFPSAIDISWEETTK